MLPAIILGRKNSKGLPGKNTRIINGKPLAFYPMKTAMSCSEITHLYLSTDDPALKEIGLGLGARIIDRPEYLASDQALGEDAYKHAMEYIERDSACSLDIVVLLFCNAVTVTPQSIHTGISMLRSDQTLDSVVTVSKYNMWSPLRARKKTADNCLAPFVPHEIFGDPKTLSCDRDSQGDVLFADMGVSVIRANNLKNLETGLLPQKWMGKKIGYVQQEAGFDVDYEWQIPVAEWWIDKYWEPSMREYN